MKVTKEQYEFAQNRVEELLPLVSDEMSASHPMVIELVLMSDVIIAYEKDNFPIEKPGIVELIEL
jgi:HTH-type transcriptional regulator/antitoxin HigA